MDLRVLRYFLTVAREQSFTKAAEQLHITQPTLSHQMAALEEELGTPLLDRRGHGITLTDQGLLLKRRALEILDLEHRIIDEVKEGSMVVEGAPRYWRTDLLIQKPLYPEITGADPQIQDYDEILIGFPIWWYVAPTIINTFLETYDFSGKKIVLFATSGGSGFGNTVKELQPSAPKAEIVAGKLLNHANKQDIENWVKTL